MDSLKKVRESIQDAYKKGFFHLFSANSLIHLIEFGSQFIVAWILLAEDVGRIKSFQSFTAVAVVVSGLGFNSSVLKLCSEKGRTFLDKQILFSSAIKSTLLFSCLIVVVIFVLTNYGLISNDAVTNKLFIYYALSVPLVALNSLIIAYFQALKAFKKVSSLLLLSKLVHVAIIVSGTYYFGLYGFVFGLVSGYLISTVLLLYKTEFLLGWKKTTKKHLKENWELAKYAFSGNAVNMLTLYFDIFLLNYFITDAKEFGYYGFALTLMAGLRIVTTTAQQFVTPFFSEFSGDYKQMMKAFKRANRLFIMIVFGVGLLAFIIIPFFIPFIDSGKYNNSIYFFQVLTVVWVVRSLPSLKGPFLLATGYVKTSFYSVLIIFAITIVPYWYLVKEYKIQGALYGQVLTALVFFIVFSISFKLTVKKISEKQKSLD